MIPLASRARTWTQKLVFTAERFDQHELANHAAAGAYAFLLSATPAVLLTIGLASALIGRHPRALESVKEAATGFLGPMAAGPAVEAFFSSRLGTFAIIVGALSLIWAARLFVVTIQRGIRLIYSASGRNTAVKENVLTFAVELASLVAVVVILVGSEGTRLLVDSEILAPRPGMPGIEAIPSIIHTALDAAPVVALLLFVHFTYLVIPSTRPRSKTAALAAILCVAAYLGFAELLRFFVDSARFSLLYGVFGRLIIVLVNVYTFFTLYFYGCELAYVHDHFDALLFARFYRVARAPLAGRIEKALFIEPSRLLSAYARAYPAGAVIFSAGEPGKTVYYVYDGEVGVYLGDGASRRRIAALGPGEVFGEMAHILDEARTATTKATMDSVLFELPPAVFDLFLRSDAEAMRRVTDSLSARLKEANRRIAEGDEALKAALRPDPKDDGDGDEDDDFPDGELL